MQFMDTPENYEGGLRIFFIITHAQLDHDSKQPKNFLRNRSIRFSVYARTKPDTQMPGSTCPAATTGSAGSDEGLVR